MNYVGVGQWRDGLLLALSLQLEGRAAERGNNRTAGEEIKAQVEIGRVQLDG